MKKILSLLLCMIMVIGVIPATVYAADFNYNDYSYGNPVVTYDSYTVEGTIFDVDLITCVTPNGGVVKKVAEGDEPDDYMTFTYQANNGWEFVGWLSYYYGTKVKATNHVYDSKYYFSKANSAYNVYRYDDASIRYNKSSGTNGTALIYAIFQPTVEINYGSGMQCSVTGTTSYDPEKQSERTSSYNIWSGAIQEYDYGTKYTVSYELTDSNYILDSVSVVGSSAYTPTGYHNAEKQQLVFDSLKGPLKINLSTRLKKQSVSYNANGGSGTMAMQTFDAGVAQALSANSFTRSGYSFAGWNKKEDNTGTAYTDKQSVTFSPANDGDSITLYAQWEKLPAAVASTVPTANTLTYKGVAQELVSQGTTNEGMMMYSLEKDGSYTTSVPSATNAGSYTVWYYVKGDGNHNDSEKGSVEVKIKKADPVIGTVSANVVNDSTALSSIVLDRTNKTVEGNLIVDAGQTLKLGENEITYTFTPNDTQNYNVLKRKVTVTVKDTIAPTGEVKIGTNKWMEFLQNISFDLFFNETQTVSVTAKDNLSGVAKIEYYESSEALDITAIRVLADDKWSEIKNGGVNVTVEDAKQFIYYIRMTDNSGNVSYLSTDGAEFDTTAPVINGVYDGQTYYTSQKFEVVDKNLNTVTVNNEPCNDYVLAVTDAETTYTIVATDKAGNTTTVIVTMKKLADITDVNSENVTPEDKTALEDAKAELEKDIEENADIYSDDEKTAIDEKIKDIDDALKVIENMEKAALDELNKSVHTGDGSNFWMWFALAFVSGGCIWGTGFYGKKRKEEN